MTAATEREVKLHPGPGLRGVELDGRPIAARTLTSIYHDTDDLRLARAGIFALQGCVDGKAILEFDSCGRK